MLGPGNPQNHPEMSDPMRMDDISRRRDDDSRSADGCARESIRDPSPTRNITEEGGSESIISPTRVNEVREGEGDSAASWGKFNRHVPVEFWL